MIYIPFLIFVNIYVLNNLIQNYKISSKIDYIYNLYIFFKNKNKIIYFITAFSATIILLLLILLKVKINIIILLILIFKVIKEFKLYLIFSKISNKKEILNKDELLQIIIEEYHKIKDEQFIELFKNIYNENKFSNSWKKELILMIILLFLIVTNNLI
jgi:hypothetical protein